VENNKKNSGNVIEKLLKNKLKASKNEDFNSGTIDKVLVSKLIDNPYQPRLSYDEKELEELAATIKENGLLQPILVMPKDDNFIIVAGHRRKRAFEMLHIRKIPVMVANDLGEKELMVYATIENVKRSDLTILEEGKAYYDLLNQGFTVGELAKKLGIDETIIGRKRNLLKLCDKVLEDIRVNKSTNDVNALSMLRKIDSDDKQYSLYKDFLKNGRGWLSAKIKSEHVQKVENSEHVQNSLYSIKDKKLTLELKTINKSKIKKIEKAINDILEEGE
jgi:ParB family chromosome partitioning protein